MDLCVSHARAQRSAVRLQFQGQEIGQASEAQMQRALAELLSREVKDPRVGSVTITAVTMAPANFNRCRIVSSKLYVSRWQDPRKLLAECQSAGEFDPGSV